MIPKVIHYCWFGGNPLPDLARKCINSWKEFLPDYEIKEWNESNYDVRKINYIAQAYDEKKYAFVSDYARFDILYQYGGIYFDTDVEVIKPLKEILNQGAFAGLERGGAIAAGLGIATPAMHPLYKEILDSYEKDSFKRSDNSLNLETVVTRVSKIFSKYGFTELNEIQNIQGITVYPVEYFCPKDYKTGILNIKDKTLTIHHYDGSWYSEAQRDYISKKQKLLKKHKVIGKYLCFFALLKYKIKDNGILYILKKSFNMITHHIKVKL